MENDAITIMTAMIQAGGGLFEVPLRVAGDLTADALKNLVSVLWHALNQVNHNIHLTQDVGICDMQTLMKKKGTELQFCRIKEDIKEDFFKDLRNRGCMFTILPDLNPEDGYKEIAFHATDTPKVLASCAKFKVGMLEDSDIPEGIIDMQQYMNNANPEVVQGMQDAYAQSMGIDPKKQDAPDEYTFSLNKDSLLAGENDEVYYFYLPKGLVPGTGYHQELIILPKSRCTEIQDGEAIEYTLKFAETYTIYDGQAFNKRDVLEKAMDISGEKLSDYFNHQREYDKSPPHPSAAQTPNVNKQQNQAPTANERATATPSAALSPVPASETNAIGINQTQTEVQKPRPKKPIPKEDVAPLEDYIRQSESRTFGKRSFTDEQIFDEADAYFFVGIGAGHDQVLAVPKADVTEQDGIYTFDVKNKRYQVFDAHELIQYDMGGPKPQSNYAEKTELLKALKAPEDVSKTDEAAITISRTTEKAVENIRNKKKERNEKNEQPVIEQKSQRLSGQKTEQPLKQPEHIEQEQHIHPQTAKDITQAQVKPKEDTVLHKQQSQKAVSHSSPQMQSIQNGLTKKSGQKQASAAPADSTKPLKAEIKNENQTQEEASEKIIKIQEAMVNQEIRKMLEKATGKNMNDVLAATKRGKRL